jgi:predicted chitinase
MSVAIKRIDIENKIFKVVVFHTHKSSEVFDFTTAEEANQFYEQIIHETEQENRLMSNNS